MRFKRIVALILAVAMAAGFTGCDKNKKSGEAIEKLLEDYIEAVNDYDLDGVIELSDWDEDDQEYADFEKTLGIDFQTDEQKKFYTYIASTIILNYDSEDIEIDGKKAVLKAKCKIVDWEEALRRSSFSDFDELLGLIRECDETRTVKVKFGFVQDGKDWKLHQVTNVTDLLSFALSGQDLWQIPDPVEPDPTDPIPTPTEEPQPTGNTGSIFAYPEAVSEYIRVLEENKEAIDNFHVDFNRPPCGIYDIDGDGTVELYFFAEGEGDGFKTGTFYVYTFDPNTRKAVPVIIAKDIAKAGVQSGGDFVIFVTGGKLGIVYTDGEEALFSYETDIYCLDFTNETDEYYQRQIYYDYDPETGNETYTVYHYEGGIENGERVMYITESWNYEDPLYEYYSGADIILMISFNFIVDEPEYPLFTKPVAADSTSGDLITYLKSVK